MNRTFWVIVVVAGLAGSSLSPQRVSQVPVLEIHGATIIAFFPPGSNRGGSDDANEALSDFQFYANRVKKPLSGMGVDFKELYVRSFRVHLGKGALIFHPKEDVGYYLIAPGKRPHVEYGVMTDADLMLVAKRYFGSSPELE